jgi:small subunit ribosomal protein S8
MVSYDTVDIPISKMKINIAKVLKTEGYIKNYKIMTNRGRRIIRIFLKYDTNGDSVIIDLQRVSTPGCRIYTKGDRVPKVLNGYGINILSTSKGLMSDREASKMGIGGEILCAVW